MSNASALDPCPAFLGFCCLYPILSEASWPPPKPGTGDYADRKEPYYSLAVLIDSVTSPLEV